MGCADIRETQTANGWRVVHGIDGGDVDLAQVNEP